MRSPTVLSLILYLVFPGQNNNSYLGDLQGQFLYSELQSCHRSVGLLLLHPHDDRRRLFVRLLVFEVDDVAGGSVERRQLALPGFELLRQLTIFAGALKITKNVDQRNNFLK
jgi:hypothetical protein